MGVWMIATGKLKIFPTPDETCIEAYIGFSKRVNPYEKMYEYFPNPWFFDEDNNLQCRAGKCAEPSMWLEYVENFFIEQGYKVEKEIKFIGEGEVPDFWAVSDEQDMKYLAWRQRMETNK